MPDYTYFKIVNPEELRKELNASGVGDLLNLSSITTDAGISVLTYPLALGVVEEASVDNIVNQHAHTDDTVVSPPDDLLVDGNESIREDFDFVGFNSYVFGSSQIISPPNANIFSGYSTTGQTLTTSFYSVPINVELEKDSIFTHTANSANVTINKTTRIFATAQYNADTDTTARTTTEGSFFLNGSIVNNAISYGYHRTTVSGEDTGSSFLTLNVTSGDILSYRVREIVGTGVLKTPTTMRIYIEEKLDE